MPEIVRYYTGEEAKLPNVETWRCREPEALQYTLDNLDKLVVKLVDGSGGYGMLVGPTASKKEIEDFRAALKARAASATSPSRRSRCRPCRPQRDEGLAPRHVDFRPFVLTGAERRHDRPRRPHPGGAARRLAGGQFEPGRRHQGQLRPRAPATQRPRRRRLMLSRTAANLYWIGRYMERAEFTTRLSRRRSGSPRSAAMRRCRAGLAQRARAWSARRRFHASGETRIRAPRRFLTLAEDNPSSIRSCLAAARDNARAARTALTREVWEAINRAWLMIHGRTSPGGVQATLNLVEESEGRDCAASRARSRGCCATRAIGSCGSAR